MKNGRRPGKPDTREAILAAARPLFAQHGFEATTMRAIAAAAGVDVALPSYHFGSKSDLFAAAIELPVNPAAVLGGVLAATAEPAARAEQLLRALLNLWDAAGGGPLAALMRSTGSQEQLLRAFVEEQILPLLRGAVIGERDADLRAAAIASQVSGLLLMRYVLRLEPLASATHDELVATLAPTLARYLGGS